VHRAVKIANNWWMVTETYTTLSATAFAIFDIYTLLEAFHWVVHYLVRAPINATQPLNLMAIIDLGMDSKSQWDMQYM